jgi:branched-chain amino acid transport system substrate-binding protein
MRHDTKEAMMSTFKIVGLTVAAIVMLATPARAQDTLKIGFPTCLSGPGAAYGESTSNAVKMAADEINAAGGVKGAKVEVVLADGKCDPREAALAAEKLVINDKVHALLGGIASSPSLAVKAVADREKVPMVEGVAGTNALTVKGNEYVFRVVPNMTMYTTFSAEHLCTHVKPKRVAYVFQQTDFGTETVEFSKAKLEACGGKTVGWFPGRPDETNFATAITSLKAQQPDVVFLIHWPPAAIAFLRQAREFGLKSTWFNVGSLSGPDFTARAGDLAEGFMGVNVFEPGSTRPLAQQFTQEYQRRYGKVPDWFAAGNYVAVKLIADAAARGGVSREGIARALAGTKGFKSLLGDIAFDATGQAPSFFTLFRYTGGKRVVVAESERVAAAAGK